MTNIGLDYGVGYYDPDQHDPTIIYSDDYPEQMMNGTMTTTSKQKYLEEDDTI